MPLRLRRDKYSIRNVKVVVTGCATDRPITRQAFIIREYLLSDNVERAVSLIGSLELIKVPLRISQPIRVIDPQAGVEPKARRALPAVRSFRCCSSKL